MANELDDLFGMVTSEADKAAMQQILDRNPIAKERAQAQAALFAALATGDDASITAAQNRFTQQPPANDVARQQEDAARRAAAVPAAATLDELTRLVTTQVKTGIESEWTAREAAIRKAAREEAEAVALAKGQEFQNAALAGADALYIVRRSHEKEFGVELDSAAFSKFVTDNAGKYASLAAAHDAMVAEERIQARIAKGIAEAQGQSASTSSLPGTTLTSTTNDSPLATMIRYNEKVTNPNAANGTPRGAALDAAVVAWRQTASGGNKQAN